MALTTSDIFWPTSGMSPLRCPLIISSDTSPNWASSALPIAIRAAVLETSKCWAICSATCTSCGLSWSRAMNSWGLAWYTPRVDVVAAGGWAGTIAPPGTACKAVFTDVSTVSPGARVTVLPGVSILLASSVFPVFPIFAASAVFISFLLCLYIEPNATSTYLLWNGGILGDTPNPRQGDPCTPLH